MIVNHRTLKLCRLICKEWNLECCRALRKRSILRVSECDNLKLKSLDDLLTQNESLNLPLPFRFCNVEIDVLENPIVQRIVEDEEFCVAVFGIREPLQLHHKGVLMKLSDSSNGRQSNILEQLVLTLSSSKAENFSITNSDSEQEALNFPKLRGIVLNGKHLERRLDEGNVISVPPVRLAVDAINAAQKLESFMSSLWDDAILLFILQHAKLQNLSRLSLSHTTPNTFHQLLSIDIRNLKILELSVDPDSIDEGFVGSEVAREVVEKYAQSLQELYITWNFNSVNDKFPYCPNLRVLSIKYWSGGLGSFDSLKLPSLKKLQVFDCINELCTERLNPHSGVEAFAFECLNGTGVRFGLYSEEDFTQVLMNVNRQFPNLTCLDLRLALTASALQRVILHFPNLKKLLLESDNEYKECIFTGVPEQDLDSSQDPYEADPVDSCGTPSFLDLKCKSIMHTIIDFFREKIDHEAIAGNDELV